jgi:outer membrane protein OmpA-like peptidoglycan-associated protein
MTRPVTAVPSLLLALVLLIPAASRGQTTLEGFAAQGYDPAYAGDGFFASPDAPVTGRISPAVKLTFSYANRPVRLVDQATGKTVAGGDVVRDQLYLDLDASLSLFNRVKIGIGLPFAAVQSGDASYTGSHSLQSTQFADMRVGARVAILGKAGDPLAFAVQADLWLPTGSKGDFAGDGYVRGHPRLVVSGLLADRVLYSAALGMMIRSHRDLGMAEIGTALSYSGAAGVLLWNKRIQVGPEVFGSTTFAGGASPVEGMLGGKICVASVVIGLGVGTGFGHAPGAAAARALASVAWEPGRACIQDSNARLDAPRPLLGEDRGVVAAAEVIRIKEDAAAAQKAQAGVAAKAAEEGRAAADLEVAQATEAPKAIELAMANRREMGAPQGPAATLKHDSIAILQQVQFETNVSVIKPESTQVLEAVAAILREHPEIETLAIEGHTDGSGDSEWNSSLSKQRAEQVRDWLVRYGGVDGKRLSAAGYGNNRPVAEEKDETGRRANRRVEFRIVTASR